MTPLLISIVVIGITAFGFWFFRPPNSRRVQELKDPTRRFHWTVISSYMGNADPTLLTQQKALEIVQDGWSCATPADLRSKMDLYRHGEINPAFDAARIVWLAELAATAGWMPLTEVVQWSTEACNRIRATYSAWPQFGDELLAGRHRWWKEVANKSMPAGDQARATEVRGEVAPLWASVPWA
jgi:hypothetical protein